MASTFNEILATPRSVQALTNKKGGSHQIIISVEGVRTFVRVAFPLGNRSRVHESLTVLEQKDAGTFLVHPRRVRFVDVDS